MTQEKIIFCQSVRVMERPVAVSQAGKCFECDISIWLAPSSVHLLLSDPEIKTLCEQCSSKAIAKAELPPIFAIAPGAIEEAMAEAMKIQNN